MKIEESQSTIVVAHPSPQASEDAAGESDNDFDPLFDDDAEPPPAPQTVPAPPLQNGGMTLPSGGGALQLHMPGSNQYPTSTPPPPLQPQQLAYSPSVVPKKETPILDPVRYNDFSPDILMTASIDGQVTLWDRRAPSSDGRGMGRLEGNERSPPWCVSVSGELQHGLGISPLIMGTFYLFVSICFIGLLVLGWFAYLCWKTQRVHRCVGCSQVRTRISIRTT